MSKNIRNKKEVCTFDDGENNFAKSPEIRKKLSDNNSMKNPLHLEKARINGNTPNLLLKKSKRMKSFWENMNEHEYDIFISKRTNTYTLNLANGKYKIKNNWKTGNFEKSDGTTEWYDSSYELKMMVELESKSICWTKKHGIRIPYTNSNGKKTFYVPDFLIGKTEICEIKGWLKEDDELKAKIAIDFCKTNGYSYKFLLGEKLEIVKNLSYESS